MIVKNVPHKANSVITARKIWWPRPRYSVSTRMWDGNYSIMEVSVKVSKKILVSTQNRTPVLRSLSQCILCTTELIVLLMKSTN